MQNTELKKLLESLSLEEKICQLLQVCGYYYEMEELLPVRKTLPDSMKKKSQTPVQCWALQAPKG